jgi:AAA+ superfamily predicted ATPase
VIEGTEGLFAGTEEFPNSDAQARLAALVGLDETVDRLVSEAVVLLDPSRADAWSSRVHGQAIPAVEALRDRTPMLIFAGDVGTGKTELAEVLGQAIAQAAGADVTLYPLSLTARGRGAVGEMTTLLTRAFDRVRKDFARARRADGRAVAMGVLLVDEADALAQSRELAQMHHEDRAGVNALLRGIDGMRVSRLPVLTILCTNRLDAIDPAVQRRAAAIQVFERPAVEQRAALLARLLAGTKLQPGDIDNLARATGEAEYGYGFTYSDLRQRLVPEIALTAYRRDSAIDMTIALEVIARTSPTRPFGLKD